MTTPSPSGAEGLEPMPSASDYEFVYRCDSHGVVLPYVGYNEKMRADYQTAMAKWQQARADRAEAELAASRERERVMREALRDAHSTTIKYAADLVRGCWLPAIDTEQWYKSTPIAERSGIIRHMEEAADSHRAEAIRLREKANKWSAALAAEGEGA